MGYKIQSAVRENIMQMIITSSCFFSTSFALFFIKGRYKSDVEHVRCTLCADSNASKLCALSWKLLLIKSIEQVNIYLWYAEHTRTHKSDVDIYWKALITTKQQQQQRYFIIEHSKKNVQLGMQNEWTIQIIIWLDFIKMEWNIWWWWWWWWSLWLVVKFMD